MAAVARMTGGTGPSTSPPVADDTDACLSTCLNAICGDSAIQAGVEECDDACVMVPMRAGPVYSSEP